MIHHENKIQVIMKFRLFLLALAFTATFPTAAPAAPVDRLVNSLTAISLSGKFKDTDLKKIQDFLQAVQANEKAAILIDNKAINIYNSLAMKTEQKRQLLEPLKAERKALDTQLRQMVGKYAKPSEVKSFPGLLKAFPTWYSCKGVSNVNEYNFHLCDQ